ncbi:hypothetical protein BU16DRAFT_590336 [Lophium mytilinum]|uniref:BTB domain-containing protein n=1 Tax=Lophium mytilinum TaxID=390894 RepID=A0A6A6QMT2_9PEZI|nr:hypothetical protein BU16DRAFT_590336 [Lophium mytilinum]
MCSQIPFFEKACKEGVYKEGHERLVDLSHDEYLAVNAMIQYAYTGDYEPRDHVNTYNRALFHVQVYAIASKYNLSDLQEVSSKRFEPVIKEGCYERWFPDVIRAVYDSSFPRDHHLRDIVANIMIEHQPAFAAKGEENFMDELLEELGGFARDCFARLSKKVKDEQEGASKDAAKMIRSANCHLCGHQIFRGPFSRPHLCPGCGATSYF